MSRPQVRILSGSPSCKPTATPLWEKRECPKRSSAYRQPVGEYHGAFDEFEETRHSRSEEHTSELQSLMRISYAVFCLKKKNNKQIITHHYTYTRNNYKKYK